MRKRAGTLLLCSIGWVGLGRAQNPPSAAQHRATDRDATQNEPVLASNRQRIQWEAAQTWSIPAIPNLHDAGQRRRIHIENDQPTLNPPKFRREWLHASSDAIAPEPMK
jgi:hypothetical protein